MIQLKSKILELVVCPRITFNITANTDPQPHITTANSITKTNIKKARVCYLCCDSCLRPGRASILDNRSTLLWSCTAHTPGCTSGDGCSSPPPRTSCCWSPGEAQGDKSTQLLSLVPQCTGGCSPLWLQDTSLGWRKAKKRLRFKRAFKKHSMCGGSVRQQCLI